MNRTFINYVALFAVGAFFLSVVFIAGALFQRTRATLLPPLTQILVANLCQKSLNDCRLFLKTSRRDIAIGTLSQGASSPYVMTKSSLDQETVELHFSNNGDRFLVSLGEFDQRDGYICVLVTNEGRSSFVMRNDVPSPIINSNALSSVQQ